MWLGWSATGNSVTSLIPERPSRRLEATVSNAWPSGVDMPMPVIQVEIVVGHIGLSKTCVPVSGLAGRSARCRVARVGPPVASSPRR